MDDALAVTMSNSFQDLQKYFSGCVFIEYCFFFEEGQQFSSWEVFHDNYELHVGEGITIQYFNDMGMPKCFEGFDLSEDLINIMCSSYITGTVLIFQSLRILMAANELSILLRASHTLPNPPYPSCLINWYSPKLRSPSKSQPSYSHFYLCWRRCDCHCGHTADLLPLFLLPPRRRNALFWIGHSFLPNDCRIGPRCLFC